MSGIGLEFSASVAVEVMPTHSTTAVAHPNIALLKYWGKQDAPGNLPAAPSLSITLDTLTTTTRTTDAPQDSITLNGVPVDDPRIAAALVDWRRQYRIPPLAIATDNNFPTAAGLASSASGFAALATAINAHCGLGLTSAERSALARRGSASAARSIHAGFAALATPDWRAEPLAAADFWPLKVVIAITSTVRKPFSSREGMAISKRTSPYFDAWTTSNTQAFEPMRDAVLKRNFEQLAELAEASCLGMHALMMSGRPGLIYWNACTVNCIHAIRAMREAGHKVFFTVDAGPQVKAVCEAPHAEAVQRVLAEQTGVLETLVAGLGEGARVITPAVATK